MKLCNFSSQGSYIREAMEGTFTSYRVGSQDEIRFWKIVRRLPPYKEFVKCFYLTPESYEKDLQLKVGETEKHLWYTDRQGYEELELESSSSK